MWTNAKRLNVLRAPFCIFLSFFLFNVISHSLQFTASAGIRSHDISALKFVFKPFCNQWYFESNFVLIKSSLTSNSLNFILCILKSAFLFIFYSNVFVILFFQTTIIKNKELLNVEFFFSIFRRTSFIFCIFSFVDILLTSWSKL